MSAADYLNSWASSAQHWQDIVEHILSPVLVGGGVMRLMFLIFTRSISNTGRD